MYSVFYMYNCRVYCGTTLHMPLPERSHLLLQNRESQNHPPLEDDCIEIELFPDSLCVWLQNALILLMHYTYQRVSRLFTLGWCRHAHSACTYESLPILTYFYRTIPHKLLKRSLDFLPENSETINFFFFFFFFFFFLYTVTQCNLVFGTAIPTSLYIFWTLNTTCFTQDGMQVWMTCT